MKSKKIRKEGMDKMSNDHDQMVHSNSSSYDHNVLPSNFISYGPIRFFSRKRKAPTFLTGRKSRFEELHGEELIQREYRREKNRLLSKKLKEKRENIQNELIEQINQLEEKQSHLLYHVDQLKSYKNDLYRKLEEIQQDPVFNLFYQTKNTPCFKEYDHSSFDMMTLIFNFN